MTTRLLEIRQGVLSRNDQLAANLRERFTAAGTFVLNVVSSPGAGKTLLLEKTITRLLERGFTAAALVGDLETDNDSQRLAAAGAPVKQIQTAGNCHLEAHMIDAFVSGWDLGAFDFLFIENVGNLVCPSSYDLGEALRVVLFSTTEGEDKPLKYPPMFFSSDVAVITKIDLAEAAEFDRDAALSSLNRVHPGIPILEVSAKRGTGMNDWLDFLIQRRAAWLESLLLARQSS
ncbi:hydrogenase nickel incorporation protein HypB [Oscillatoria laete-virens NRMC-F 0139]|nr:hydrogenase nickel incorporation protein HypB [Oscillatoria laete-virens]MDL5055430.1 hydrogenase nickel incorporation protein HypB [Oscillatoria laete-virens NRMC-F 0139]